MLSISIFSKRQTRVSKRIDNGKKLTKNDITFETEIKVCDVAKVVLVTDKHVNIRACNTIDDFLFGDTLDFLRFPLVGTSQLVVESVGSGPASVWLLDRADYEVKLLLAHLFLKVS